MQKKYGYIRVSSHDQNEERQRIALSDWGILESNLFLDKQSGKDFQRPAYRRMLKKLEKGDLVVVQSIDRLGRNYEEILEQWRYITKEIRANIKVLDMPLLDTRKDVTLTGTVILDIVLQLLSYVAQSERESIRKRQAEGIEAARRRGVKFGRPAIEKPAEFYKIYERWLRGEIPSRRAAAALETSQTTFLKWAKEQEKEKASKCINIHNKEEKK